MTLENHLIDKTYYVGYDCGKAEQKKAEKCKESTVDDLSVDNALMSPCMTGDDKLANCPGTGTNVTVSTCYCMGDYCNFSSDLHPRGAWIMMVVCITTLMNWKSFA